MRRYGAEGQRLWRLARGIDARVVDPERETKSVSAETPSSGTSPRSGRWRSGCGSLQKRCRRG